MRALRRTFLTGTLAVAAALFTTMAAQASSPAGGIELAAPTSDKLQDALPDPSSFPSGTSITEKTVADASRAGMFGAPPGVTVSPSSCVNLVAIAAGSITRLSGWLQVARTPDGRTIGTVLGTIPGGANLNAVSSTVANCRPAAVTLPGGITGTLSMSLFAVAAQNGTQAIGIREVASFPSNPAMNVTNYQVYAVSGDSLALTCGPEEQAVTQSAQSLLQQITS